MKTSEEKRVDESRLGDTLLSSDLRRHRVAQEPSAKNKQPLS